MKLSCIVFGLLCCTSAIYAANTYTIIVGSQGATPVGEEDAAWYAINFYPSEITIQQGDSITFHWQGTEFHSVTFGTDVPAPFVFNPVTGHLELSNLLSPPPYGIVVTSYCKIYNGGFQDVGGPDYTLTFPVAGEFPFQCLIHPMTGLVTVTYDPAPLSPAQVTANAEATLLQTFQTANLLESAENLLADGASYVNNEDGTRTHYVRIYGNFFDHLSRFRFTPEDITIELGDSIVFVNGDIMAHIIAFNGTAGNLADFNIVPFDGPAYFNPVYVAPSGGDDFEGGFATSGLLSPLGVGEAEGAAWEVTFNSVGIYPYQCVIHDGNGMDGTVTIVERRDHDGGGCDCESGTDDGEDDDSGNECGVQTQINFNFAGLIPPRN